MGDRGSDDAQIQVLEAVLIGIITVAAVGFVLTYEAPTSKNELARDGLGTKASDALGVLNELPSDDTKYGKTALSQAVARALQGDDSDLRRRLDALLPPGTKYNVYLYNGQESYDVLVSGSPRGETVTATHVLEPEWVYTFLARDSDYYTDPQTLGVYALPVYNSNVLDDGGVPVVVSVDFSRQGHAWTTKSVYSTVQGATDADGHEVASSVYGSTAGGTPKPYWKRTIGGPDEGQYTLYVTVEEGEGGTIPAGTRLVIRVPQGQKASYVADGVSNPDWIEVPGATSTDGKTMGTLEATLKNPLSAGKVLFEFKSEYTGEREYDFYVLDVTLSGSQHGRAEIVLQDAASAKFTGGDYIDVYATVPKPMGSDATTVWSVVVTDPSLETDAAGAAKEEYAIRIDRIRIEQPDGIPIFAEVGTRSGPDGATFRKVDGGSALEWDPEPSHRMSLSSDGLAFVLDVKANGQKTRNDQRDYLTVPVTVNTGADEYTMELTRRVEPGLFYGHVPPQKSSPGPLGYKTGATNERLSAAPVYRGELLNGTWSFNSSGTVLSKDVFSMLTTDVQKREVSWGETAEAEINVENLVADLLLRGLDVTTTTRIYPPWGGHTPVFTDEAVRSTAVHRDVTKVIARDVTGDGVKDLVVTTNEGKLVAFDTANDGAVIVGSTKTWKGQAVRDVASLEPDHGGAYAQVLPSSSSQAAFVVGLEAQDGLPTLVLLDKKFEPVASPLAFEKGVFDVADVAGGMDLDGDGAWDYAAGDGNGNVAAFDGTPRSSQAYVSPEGWPKRNNLRQALVTFGRSGPDAEPTLIATNGLEASVKFWRSEDVTNTTRVGPEGDLLLEAQAKADSTVSKTIEAVKKVQISGNTDGLFGYDVNGEPVWAFPGGGFRDLEAVDLDADGFTDVVSGTWDGYVFALNGRQASPPWLGESILSGDEITDSDFVDADWGWTVDLQGFSMWTSDGFTTRNYTKNLKTGAVIVSLPGVHGLDLVDRRLGYAVGLGGQMWITHDSGASVQELVYTVVLPTTELDTPLWGSSDFLDVEFRDPKNGLVVGTACTTYCLGKGALPLYTVDGGTTWNVPATVPPKMAEVVRMNRVTWASDTVALAVGSAGSVFRSEGVKAALNHMYTTPVGLTWTDLSPPNQQPTDAFYGADCINKVHCWVVGTRGQIWKYHIPPGQTAARWDLQRSGVAVTLRDVDFVDSENGVAVGDDTTVLVTRDGGKNWVLTPPLGPTAADFNSVDHVAPETAYFFGGNLTTRAYGFTTGYVSHAKAQTLPLLDLSADSTRPNSRIEKVWIAPVEGVDGNGDIVYEASTDGGRTWTALESEFDAFGEETWIPTKVPSGKELRLRFSLSTDISYNAHTPVLKGLDAFAEVAWDCAAPCSSPPVGATCADGVCRATFQAPADIGGRTRMDPDHTTPDAWVSVAPGAGAEIRLPQVRKLWTQHFDGRINDLDASRDVNDDGWKDVVVAVGPLLKDPSAPPSAWTNVVHVLDGRSGAVLMTWAPTVVHEPQVTNNEGASIDATVEDIETARMEVIQVGGYVDPVAEPWRVRWADVGSDGVPPDGIPEIVVAVFDHEKASANGTTRLTILNLTLDGRPPPMRDEIGFYGRPDVLLVTDLNLTDGPHDDLVLGTTEYTFTDGDAKGTSVPGHVHALYAEDRTERNDGVWTRMLVASPDIGGRYVVSWTVPRSAPFGPHPVETEVRWADQTGAIQSINLVDYFTVVPKDANLPVSPIYTVQLVTWFEDWDYSGANP